MWYTSKDIGPFSTCILHANLKTRFEYGISHLVCLARYYHANGTKSLRRLRSLSNKHKLSDRNVKRVMSHDCHVINRAKTVIYAKNLVKRQSGFISDSISSFRN